MVPSDKGVIPLRPYRQTTLSRPVRLEGVGLHSGTPASVEIRPARVNHGIIFRRADVAAAMADVPARYDLVVDTLLCTALANEHGTRVATIEHLMAALHGLGVSNALVVLDGPEIPIMDGSAEPFRLAIAEAGLVEQSEVWRAIRIISRVEIREPSRSVVLEPHDGFALDLEIDYPGTAVARQRHQTSLRLGFLDGAIADCRTFGFRHEVEALRSMGRALGGSLDNAVVVDGESVMNPEGLRRPDEFVRHKVLDAIGDLALAGRPIIGRLVGRCSGHQLNNMVLRKLFDTPSAYVLTDAPARPAARWPEAAAAFRA
ncbi:UDP-3-O-acyl-N-acetylglucosamine deacetylase [Zavarzinia sp. CC-PAN008]|uniref:UDP-3-O-acyl-N-acetylglucosamine deacetylase n=1 Tax=Zavarzinia sp. CC-PAN008 TaxID=3243332 RepID=UPI003F742F56